MIKLSSGFIMARDSVRLLNVTRSLSSICLSNRSTVLSENRFNSSTLMLASLSTSSQLSVSKEWTQTLTRAEQVVSYPTSFLNLRYLVTDEMANFANLFRKLMNTKHPLISLAHKLIFNGVENEPKRALQINGIIVLLIAKAAGIPSRSRSSLLPSDISEGILNSQRSLAEITEMIYIGSLIHRGIVNLTSVGESIESKQMDQANKLAVLCGDYLLASACNNLSKLKNSQVVGLMSEVIADISQSKFVHNASLDNQNNKSSYLTQWYEKINSTTSILLSNSAKAALLLVSHSPNLQETAWSFAKHLNLAHRVWSDLVDLKQDQKMLESDQETILYAIYKDRYGQQDVKKVLMSSSSSSTTAVDDSSLDSRSQTELINDCKLIFTEHYQLAMSSLAELENEHSEREAIGSLRSILNVMKDTI